MNPCVADLVSGLSDKGHALFGFRSGYVGIMEDDYVILDKHVVQGWHKLGGSALKTGRLPSLREKEVQDRLLFNLTRHEIEVLIVIGGDGSFNGALQLCRRSEELSRQGKVRTEAICPEAAAEGGVADALHVIGIPGTIDNNIFGSDYTLGFDTALNKQMCYIDDITDTAMSLPGRVFFVETLGAWDGYLAESSVKMGMADFSVLVERPLTNEQICDRVHRLLAEEKKDYVIVTFAEGTYQTQEAAKYVENKLGVSVKVNLLGYAQRGGVPTALERLHASGFADFAVEMVEGKIYNKYIVFSDGEYRHMDISMAARKKKFNW